MLIKEREWIKMQGTDFIEKTPKEKKSIEKQKRKKARWKWLPFVSKKEFATEQVRFRKRMESIITNYNLLLERSNMDEGDAGLNNWGTKRDYLSQLDLSMGTAESIELANSENRAKKGKLALVVESMRSHLRTMFGVFGVYNIPTAFDDSQFHAQRTASWGRYLLDPIAGNIADQLLYFALGKGIQVSSLVKEVDEYLNKVLTKYHFSNNQKWDFRRTILDGEMHWFLKPDEDEKIMKMERLPASFIEDQLYYKGKLIYYKVDSSFWEDTNTTEIDEGKWYKSSRFDEFEGDKLNVSDKPEVIENDATIYTIKYGDSKRGEPFLVRVLRWCQIDEELAKDVARLIHEQSRILIKKTVYQENIDDTTSADRILEAPPGGYMIVEVKGRKEYTVMQAKFDGQGLVPGLRNNRLRICAGTHTPEHIAYQDASNNNYASILEAKNPYIIFISWRQDWYREELDMFFRRNIELAVEHKYLEEKVMAKKYKSEAAISELSGFIMDSVIEGISVNEIVSTSKKIIKTNEIETEILPSEVIISINFPALVSEDPLKFAQAMSIHYDLGIDQDTIWQKLGYKPAEIWVRKMKDKQKQKDDEEEEMRRFNQGKSTSPPDFTKDEDKK
jgi:urease gamma subunit